MRRKEFLFSVNDKVTLTNHAANIVLSRTVYKHLKVFKTKLSSDDFFEAVDELEMSAEEIYKLSSTLEDVWSVVGTWKKGGTIFCEIVNLRNNSMIYLSQNLLMLNQDYEGYAES